jgi:hypothetical protein
MSAAAPGPVRSGVEGTSSIASPSPARLWREVANPVSREAPSAATRFPFGVLLEEGS